MIDAVKRHAAKLIILVMAPLLMNQAGEEPQQAEYVELNPRWEHAGVVTGASLGSLAGAVAIADDDNCLVAVDSNGTAFELRFVDGSWTTARTFDVGHPVTVLAPGAPQHDRRWRAYVGSQEGQVSELTITDTGWVVAPVLKFDDPIVSIEASDPGRQGVSQLFVVDGAGDATNLWIGYNQQWVARPIPRIDGGITDLSLHVRRTGIHVLACGPRGHIHQFVQDTMGYWSGDIWAEMPCGVTDMAASVDPTMKDLALYFSGDDGHFRYLFHGYKTDEKARVPIAADVDYLIGKENGLRYNEFMGTSRNEYCQFEFNFTTRRWDRIPLLRMPEGVVSSNFGKGRPGRASQFFVTGSDGRIHEFVRKPPPPPDSLDVDELSDE